MNASHAPDEIALLTFVGEQMGSAVARSVLEDENARLQEEAQEAKRQLELAQARRTRQRAFSSSVTI